MLCVLHDCTGCGCKAGQALRPITRHVKQWGWPDLIARHDAVMTAVGAYQESTACPPTVCHYLVRCLPQTDNLDAHAATFRLCLPCSPASRVSVVFFFVLFSLVEWVLSGWVFACLVMTYLWMRRIYVLRLGEDAQCRSLSSPAQRIAGADDRDLAVRPKCWSANNVLACWECLAEVVVWPRQTRRRREW